MPHPWKTYKLSEIIQIIGGGTPKTSVAEYWNGEIPWLSVKDFQGERKYVYETEKSITDEGLKNSSTKLLDKGSIIISARGTVGELAVLKKQMAFNQSCYGIQATEKSDSDYLYYLLKHKIDRLKALSYGSVFDTITTKTFDNLDVSLPAIEEQKSIAQILSAIDDKIENNLAINKTLEEMAMALYKHWFVDFGPFKDGEFVESEFGMIPKGWELKRIGEIASLKYGKALKKTDRIDGVIPVYGSSGIVGHHAESIIGGPAIIIGRKGNVGSVFWEENSSWPIDTVYFVKDISRDLLKFLYFKFLTTDFNKSNSDSVVPGLNRNVAHNEKLVLPPSDVLYRFMKVIMPIYNSVRLSKTEMDILKNTRNSMISKLTSGEIRLKEFKKEIAEIL